MHHGVNWTFAKYSQRICQNTEYKEPTWFGRILDLQSLLLEIDFIILFILVNRERFPHPLGNNFIEINLERWRACVLGDLAPQVLSFGEFVLQVILCLRSFGASEIHSVILCLWNQFKALESFSKLVLQVILYFRSFGASKGHSVILYLWDQSKDLESSSKVVPWVILWLKSFGVSEIFLAILQFWDQLVTLESFGELVP